MANRRNQPHYSPVDTPAGKNELEDQLAFYYEHPTSTHKATGYHVPHSTEEYENIGHPESNVDSAFKSDKEVK